VSELQLWSPYLPNTYAVYGEDGTEYGIRFMDELNSRRGLWNMVWLHSLQIDVLANWSEPPEMAPNCWHVYQLCVQSMSYSVGGVALELLAERLSAEMFIERILNTNSEPRVKEFFDEPENDSWESFVKDRLKMFYGLENPVIQPKPKIKLRNNVVRVNFLLRKKS